MRRIFNILLVGAVWVGLLLLCVSGTNSHLTGIATCFVAGVGVGRICRAVWLFLGEEE